MNPHHPSGHRSANTADTEASAEASHHDDGRTALARAITAVTRYRALAPDVFYHEPGTQDPRRRAMAEAYIAGAMGVAPDHVTITDDPARRYGPDQQEGVLISLTDPDTGRRWRFIPDLYGHGLVLLDSCPACRAPSAPRVYLANQRDLDGYLGSDPDDLDGMPLETNGDPAHRQTCRFAPPDTP